MDSQFDRQKIAALSGVDLSRKGSIDAPIEELIHFINLQKHYFTTSSCSGRIIVFDNETDGAIKKKGCKWILTSHEEVDNLAVATEDRQSDRSVHDLSHQEFTMVCLKDIVGNAVFKFEPFVLHVQSRSLSDAQVLLSCGVASGFRNSGISLGNKGKYITAIRSTHSLEVPLSQDGKILVSSKYIAFIVDLANKKMAENIDRINRFFINVQKALLKSNSSVEAVTPKKPIHRHKSKKTQETGASSCAIPDSGPHSNPSNSSTDDLSLDTCCLFEFGDVT